MLNCIFPWARGIAAIMLLVTLLASGCSSEKTMDSAVEHKIYYEGWRHPATGS